MALLIKKFKHAIKGLIILLQDTSVGIQIGITLIVLTLCYVFGINSMEWCIILLCCALVIVSECINTIIEYICDFIQPEYDEQIKKIKDGAAGFVLIASIFALMVGCIILKGYLC